MPLNLVAKAAITVAMTGLNMAIQSSRNLGDRGKLDDTAITQGDYGASIPRIWGTRRIEGAPIFWAEPLTEVRRRRKTKGGKYNEYTYFGSWACALASHEIAGCTRIWFDKHLIYDATGAGSITALSANAGFVLSEHIRFYLGTETQEADPYMLASVESAQGVGSCPAYRGTAYVMFEQIPLEKFGNRIPQVTVEVAGLASPVYPRQDETTIAPQPNRLWGMTIDHENQRMLWAIEDYFEVWDLPSRTRIASSRLAFEIGLCSRLGLYADGSFLAVYLQKLYSFGSEGEAGTEIFDFGGSYWQSEVRVIADGNGVEHWATIPYSSLTNVYIDGTRYDPAVETGTSFVIAGYFADLYGDVWAVGRPYAGSGSVTTAHFWRIVDTGARPGSSGFLTVTGLPALSLFLPDMEAVHYRDNDVDQFVFHWDRQRLVAVDIDTGAINAEVAVSLDVYNTDKQFANLKPGAETIWLGATERSLKDLSVVRTVTLSSWGGHNAEGVIYDRLNHALITAPNGSSEIAWRFLDRISGDGTTLQAIADDVAESCGITGADFSAFSGITVNGWSVSSATGIDALQPLLDIYDCDIRTHDFSVQGVTRGGATGGTIDYLDFVPNENGRYAVKIAQAAEMPRAIVLNFADKDNDQQVNSVRVSRPEAASDTEGEVSIDLTEWVATADVARQCAGRYFRRRWNSREVISLNLTAQQISLEPADLRTLSLETDDRLGRLVRSTLTAGGVMSAEFVADDASLYLLDGAAGPSFDGRIPETITVPGPVRGFVLDVPLAIDAHDSAVPFLYYAAGPYGEAFAGADFAVSDTSIAEDFVEGWAAVQTGDAADWGTASAALGDALPWIFDDKNSLNVQMRHGTPPVGVTRDELLADGALNLVLVGDEWLQYQSRTLEADGTYTLSGLLRGCRGTEYAIGGHAAGEAVLFAASGLFRRDVGASEIGDTDLYRAASPGREVSGAYQTSLTFSAAANKPYAPVHGIALKDSGSGDWTIYATRRTRIGGANVDGQDVPLGEVSESWSADIMDGATVKRTITGTSLPLTYTAAQQTTDWGAGQSSIEVNLYQVSPALALRGFALNIAA